MMSPTEQGRDQIVSPARNISLKASCWIVLMVSIFSLWIRAGIPLVAVSAAVHDDEFFIRTARYLAEGQWLGPYDKMTLTKGMFYPVFIVSAFGTSIPLKIAEHGLYLAASGLAALVVIHALHRRWTGLVLFGVLALNPVLWSYDLARVSREGLYTSLSLALFTLVALISYPELRKTTHRLTLGSVFGVVWACFWLTREESIWLLPACLILIGTGIANQLLQSKSGGVDRLAFCQTWERLTSIAAPLIVGTLVFLAGIGLIAGVNRHYYGLFQTNEFRSGSFLRAYGALSRIKPNHFRRQVPVPLDARQRAYDVSSAARELSSSLDGDTGRAWAKYGCVITSLAEPCDLQAGWFMWALRDAVAEKGHYHSAKEASNFYARLADEVNAACESGNIPCLPARETLMPPFRREYLGEIFRSAGDLSMIVFTMGNGEVGAVPSVGSPQGLTMFAEMTHQNLSQVLASSRDNYPLGRVEGWVASRSGSPGLKIISHTQRAVTQSITITPAPDVTSARPGEEAVRYSLESSCPILECDLAVSSDAGQVLIPFRSLVDGVPLDTPSLMAGVDHGLAGEDSSLRGEQYNALRSLAGGTRGDLQKHVGSVIAQVYARSFLTLSIAAIGGLILAIATSLQRGPLIPLMAIALGSLVAVASRIALLAYIDAVSFPTHFLYYCSPASPFLIIFVVLGIYLGLPSTHRNRV